MQAHCEEDPSRFQMAQPLDGDKLSVGKQGLDLSRINRVVEPTRAST
jgi:hypothetical protein